jgi:Fe-S oxidoreductase
MSASARLPLLSAQEGKLQLCGYCPKLCRAMCPVSNAEPRDTITPWGKMTVSWLMQRGQLPVDADHAAVAWACTACYACTRARCDHENPVADVLCLARAECYSAGVAPPGAERAARQHGARVGECAQRSKELRALEGVDPTSRTALLVGCSYLRQHPEESRDIVQAAARLAGPVRLVQGCCGAPLLYAGDYRGFKQERSRLLDSVRSATLLIVADPGCAVQLTDARPVTLIELAARHLSRLVRLDELAGRGPVRWHDPCQLGRGLRQYDAPRAILARLLGRPPDEFSRNRVDAACSGAGGLLPLSMPDNSARIADARIAEHLELGGGTIVTACGSSLRRLRSRNAHVLDLGSLIRQSLE